MDYQWWTSWLGVSIPYLLQFLNFFNRLLYIYFDYRCVLANTNNEGGIHRNKSLFCVRLDSPGTVSLPYRCILSSSFLGVHRNTSSIRKFGMHSSDTAEIFFDDVIVPSGTNNIIYSSLQSGNISNEKYCKLWGAQSTKMDVSRNGSVSKTILALFSFS